MLNLIKFTGHIYYLISPVIIGAVINMVFVRLPVLKSLKIPMDCKKTLKDGKRIFGGNKTWKGFFGMIVFTALFAFIIMGNFFHGALLGFAYVLFELPNSFINAVEFGTYTKL